MGKWLISQLLLFSRLKTDGESIIVTRHIGKNNVFHSWGTSDCQFVWLQHSPSTRVAIFILIGNCSFSPLVKQMAISCLLRWKKKISYVLKVFLLGQVYKKVASRRLKLARHVRKAVLRYGRRACINMNAYVWARFRFILVYMWIRKGRRCTVVVGQTQRVAGRLCDGVRWPTWGRSGRSILPSVPPPHSLPLLFR